MTPAERISALRELADLCEAEELTIVPSWVRLRPAQLSALLDIAEAAIEVVDPHSKMRLGPYHIGALRQAIEKLGDA